MGKRKEYSIQNPRLPLFTSRFRTLVDECGGISKASEMTKISRPTINFWYNGQRTPDAENLIVLSDAFGVTTDYLLGKSDVPNIDTSLQSVNKVTGLSVGAIIKLSDIKTNDSALTEIISLLLEDHNCEYFLALIQGLLHDKIDLVELEIQGEKMRIEDRHLLAAVLQSHLIENIGELSKRYNA